VDDQPDREDEDEDGGGVDPDQMLAALGGRITAYTADIAPGQWVIGGWGQAGRAGGVLEVTRIEDPDEFHSEVEFTVCFFYRSPGGEWRDGPGSGSGFSEWPLPRPTANDEDVTLEHIAMGGMCGVWMAAVVGIASAAVARLETEYAGTSQPVEVAPSGLFVAPLTVVDVTQTLVLVAFDAQGQERSRHEVRLPLFDSFDALLKWPDPGLWPD